MRSLSDEEIDFIYDDIKSRGITLKELQENLLDHICCVIENELSIEEDFYKFYESVLPRFFKKELAEIQTETENLLRFKNFYTMKKILKISGIATVFFTVLGSIFKTFHWPGAGFLILVGGFLFSVVFLTLLIIIKLKDDDKLIDKLVTSFGFVLAIGMSAGLIFKQMHWQFAGGILLYSTLIFSFIYVPVYFLTRFRRPELKFNVAVNSVLMMACGGIFYSLLNVNGSQYYQRNLVENHRYIHEHSERLFENNKQLITNEELPNSVNVLHQISASLNDELEKIVEMILNKIPAKEIAAIVRQLDKNVDEYNLEVEKLEVPNIINLDTEPLFHLSKADHQVAITVLSRMQQQIAINENTYISSLLIQR